MRFPELLQSGIASVAVCSALTAPVFAAGDFDLPPEVSVSSDSEFAPEFAVNASEDAEESDFELSNWLQDAQPPVVEFEPSVQSPTAATDLAASVFGDTDSNRSLLSQARRARTHAPGTNIVLGSEGRFRVTSDSGSLLGRSHSTRGVAIQSRNPIVTDPRIRGDRIGRLVASGSYWFPARQDLDTALSKIDSRVIENMIVVKGPYAVIYGPGFDFVDFELLPAPRYFNGPEQHGSTQLEYLTNGEQFYGRQSAWGGNDTYGYRVSYGHRTGNDYETGNGSHLPTSYNSRDLDLALGYDISPDSRIDFNYLRLDQTNVEFPGLVFDINALQTDGFSLTYALENQAEFDLLTAEGWYNRTAFTGDTFRSGKNRQIPSLVNQLDPNFGLGKAITNVDAYSAGYRLATSWGDPDESQLKTGTDLIYLGQRLDEIGNPFGENPFGGAPLDPRNYPIPRSHSSDIGLFAEQTTRPSDQLHVHVGGRVDFVSTDARNLTEGTEFYNFWPSRPVADFVEFKNAGLDQNFVLWSLFTTAQYEINDCWMATAGAGHGQRPPTLTELYASGSFIGATQPGLSFLEGDPELDPEKRTQIDLGLNGDFGRSRMALNGYYAWINDFITFEDVLGNAVNDFFNPFRPPALQRNFTPGRDFQNIVYTNTDLATLAGFEFLFERDLSDVVTGFATVSYVEGRDHTRNEVSRLAAFRRAPLTPPFFNGTEQRSLATNDDEPLPGIVPLEARVGLRWREPVADPGWGLELEARIVDNQDRVATSLYEQVTPGFTIWNLRGFWRPYDDFTIIAGVENFTDKYYREHLDYRSGLGVFQPGSSYYCSTELTY